MVYLDYSATTPLNKEVLESFNKVCIEYPGNANSLHKLGRDTYHLMEAATKQVADLLKVDSKEVIFTSGASESNNLAIIGTALKYKNRGNHILTTKLEHSSVLETVNHLEKNGFEVEYIKLLKNGKIDLNDLKNKIKETTILVSINHVNSEIGIIQDVNEIGSILKEYPKIVFHVDGTQAVGKIKVNLDNIDLYSFSSHKIYGIKGVGCLIKKRHIELMPIIHGGKSQTIYRSGTPSVPLYVSLAKALKLALGDFDNKYNHVLELNKYLKKNLETMKLVHINSNEECVPHILNLSIRGIKPETMMHALAEYDIYISTKTACANDDSLSLAVYEVTMDKELAKNSIRISLSSLTTYEEIDYFLKIFKEKINELSIELGE
ncbi:MAG: cysteine desulfurase [Bacilli bacterium]|nr:cysteine desulfurase [Bacilli bacterium]